MFSKGCPLNPRPAATARSAARGGLTHAVSKGFFRLVDGMEEAVFIVSN